MPACQRKVPLLLLTEGRHSARLKRLKVRCRVDLWQKPEDPDLLNHDLIQTQQEYNADS